MALRVWQVNSLCQVGSGWLSSRRPAHGSEEVVVMKRCVRFGGAFPLLRIGLAFLVPAVAACSSWEPRLPVAHSGAVTAADKPTPVAMPRNPHSRLMAVPPPVPMASPAISDPPATLAAREPRQGGARHAAKLQPQPVAAQAVASASAPGPVADQPRPLRPGQAPIADESATTLTQQFERRSAEYAAGKPASVAVAPAQEPYRPHVKTKAVDYPPREALVDRHYRRRLAESNPYSPSSRPAG